MQDNQYAAFRHSAEEFIKQFQGEKEKKIVLYGIGQYTAALLPELSDFHIIGLMDGDASNIGKMIYGYKILSREEAEKSADLIIINTSSFYWEMIYSRLEDIRIPVYYANGSRAYKKESSYVIRESLKLSFDEMKRHIDCNDVISFDFYDTLVMRLVYSPRDVLKITELRAGNEVENPIPFCELRNKAEAALMGEEYTLDDVYQHMVEERNIEKDTCERLKALEIDTEKTLTIARRDMVKLYDYAVQKKKEVYILSDMYLSKEIIKDIAHKCGIAIDDEHLWISCELKKSKKNGAMWKLFAKKVAGRKALHFGDSLIGDEQQPQKAGISSLHIPNAIELLENCVLAKGIPYINSIHSSMAMGILLNELFNSPFVFHKADNIFRIDSCRTFGKCIFGDVILTFLLKIFSEISKQEIGNLVFFARDGYFLQQNFALLCGEVGVNIPTSYLYVSRRAILCAASDDKEAYERLMMSDYNGSFGNYLKERFDVSIKEDDTHSNVICSMPNDYQNVKDWMVLYQEEIQQNLVEFRKCYRKYLGRFDWEKKTAIVDICYTGSIQYWLSKIIDKRITGFYFVADLSDANEFNKVNPMIACFQSKTDLKAEKSQIWKNHKIVESLYTAPYGTIQSIDRYGNPRVFSSGNNQRHFIEREEMNGGINEFISEYVRLVKKMGLDVNDIAIDSKFTDVLFGLFFDGGIHYGEVIKQCFWHEDCFINSSKEYGLF